MPRWLWIVLGVLTALLWWAMSGGPPAAIAVAERDGGIPCPLPPRFVDASQPLQSPLPAGMQPVLVDGARVEPLAGFSLQARVLSREDYSLGREARFSPTDLALGWGPMAEPGMAERLGVRQSGRWYRYGWGPGGPPLAPDSIAVNSANMHIVPRDSVVARRLRDVKAGDVVRLQGWLVRIEDPSGWHWQSSLRRDDTGAGACELVLVCSIE